MTFELNLGTEIHKRGGPEVEAARSVLQRSKVRESGRTLALLTCYRQRCAAAFLGRHINAGFISQDYPRVYWDVGAVASPVIPFPSAPDASLLGLAHLDRGGILSLDSAFLLPHMSLVSPNCPNEFLMTQLRHTLKTIHIPAAIGGNLNPSSFSKPA